MSSRGTATGTSIEPLRALRYDQSRVSLDDVVAPPYDVITESSRAALARRCDFCVVRLELPESPRQAGDLLHEWRREGVLQRDEEPTIWWHEQRFTGPDGVDRTRSAFFAAVRLRPYEEGRIRPHERTHEAVKGGRLELMRATRTNLSPIFGLYDDPDGVAQGTFADVTAREPDMRATDDDGTEHRFWAVTDPDEIAAAQEALADHEILIADGHHRYETALAYRDEQREREGNPEGDRPYDFILMALSNLRDEGLTIFPTHRVVMSKREVERGFMSAFDCRELPAGTPAAAVEAELNQIPSERIAFAVWRGMDVAPVICELRDTMRVMMAMPGVPKPVRSVDAAVLEALVLSPLLGLEGEQFLHTDQVRYVRGLDAATALVETGEAGSVFLLRAPTVDQVRAVATSGSVMPQKATYFFPKLYSGFLLNPLTDE
jgi:uncharacterized protein (DUF1015 family)